MHKKEALKILQNIPLDDFTKDEQLAFFMAKYALEHQLEIDKLALMEGHRKCVLGKDVMYSDNTLQGMSKADLIHLLHIAQHNYSVVLEEYHNRMKYFERENKKLTENLNKLKETSETETHQTLLR